MGVLVASVLFVLAGCQGPKPVVSQSGLPTPASDGATPAALETVSSVAGAADGGTDAGIRVTAN